MVLGDAVLILSADVQTRVIGHEPNHLIGLVSGDLQRSAEDRADLLGELS